MYIWRMTPLLVGNPSCLLTENNGTMQVSRALDDPESTPESIRKAFELVELEIFKLLAYDPFVRFKRYMDQIHN